MMTDVLNYFSEHHLRILDIIGAVLGIIYILLEYRASIYLWLVSIIMPLVDMFLYFDAGLYADFGMAIYYSLAAIYGFLLWKFGKKSDQDDSPIPITHFPTGRIIPTVIVFILIWSGVYAILVFFTNSTVPITDSFVNALSIIALWALAHKYIEQWLIWIVVDAICCALYAYKGIPFKAALYGLYVFIAILGYKNWLYLSKSNKNSSN